MIRPRVHHQGQEAPTTRPSSPAAPNSLEVIDALPSAKALKNPSALLPDGIRNQDGARPAPRWAAEQPFRSPFQLDMPSRLYKVTTN